MMTDGIMSEIDNLIAAMSLTEISDFLGVQVFAEVPQVQVMQGEMVNRFLYHENQLIDTSFFVKTVLSGAVVNISPYFLWMLDQNFTDKLRLNYVS